MEIQTARLLSTCDLNDAGLQCAARRSGPEVAVTWVRLAPRCCAAKEIAVFGDPCVCAVLQGTNPGERVELGEQPSSKGHVEDQVNGFGSRGIAVVCERPRSCLCVGLCEVEPFENAGSLGWVQPDARFSVEEFDRICGARAKPALPVKN